MSQSYQLSQLAVLKVCGEDAAKFLQGQLTADVVKQADESWLFAGHCDAKGKLWSVMRVVKMPEAFFLLMAKASVESSLAQLQKFAVFSKAEITDISAELSIEFTASADPARAPHDVTTDTSGQIILHLPEAGLKLHTHTRSDAPVNDQVWQSYELEHGIPQLTPATIGEYVPQMVGLDRLGGVNFKKGCYIGQETVARMHYLGQNKRLPRLISGSASDIPAAGATLERQMGDNWRRAGAVLNAVRYDNSDVAVLAVLPADIEDNVTIRIKGDEQSQLTLHPKFDNQEISNE